MRAYVVRRLLGMAVNLVLVAVFVFFVLRVIPGEPTVALAEYASEEQIQEFRELHGLDKPVVLQFFDWAGGLLTLDFGNSLRTGFSVTDEFMSRLPRTLEIVAFSFVVATVFGIVGGIISATKQDSGLDYGVRVFAILGLSIPDFLLLTLLLIIPARLFDYSPPFGAIDFAKEPLANLELMIPPTILLAIGSSASLMRLTRTAFLDVFRQDYMRTARSKGLAERTITYRHGLRNAIAPVLTLAGLQLGRLLGGTIVLEFIFGLQGLGLWTLDAINYADYPVIMASVLWTAVMLMLINLIVDLAYAVVDPRIRYS